MYKVVLAVTKMLNYSHCVIMTNICVMFRWTTIGWPHKIEVQMEQTLVQLTEDEERFRKLQQSDQTSFEDKLDGLQVLFTIILN